MVELRGIGTDLVSLTRIEAALARHGERFVARIHHPVEIARLQRHGEPLSPRAVAKSFAAKEAVVKALGTGFRNGIGWQDIEIGRDPLGMPTVALHGRAKARVAELGGHQVWLSLSDEGDYALAFAVLV